MEKMLFLFDDGRISSMPAKWYGKSPIATQKTIMYVNLKLSVKQFVSI
jgi:hypothetical protein